MIVAGIRAYEVFGSHPVSSGLLHEFGTGAGTLCADAHIIEKLTMLAAGDLTQAIDIGDLLFPGAPWVVLVAKTIRLIAKRG